MKTTHKNNHVLIVSIAIIIIFIVFIVAIWKIGLFTFTGTDPSAKIVAASIVLIGGLFSSVVTIFGLLLKHTVDLRNLAMQERNEALAKEAENRLREEAAIKSIELLSTSSGSEAPNIQKAGVLLSLGSLKKFGIALSLAEHMMENSSIDERTFCWLLDKAVLSEDEVVQDQAVLTLGNHIAKLKKPGGKALYPASLLQIDTHLSLPTSVRAQNLSNLIDLITVQSYSTWSHSVLSTIFQVIYQIWKNDIGFIKEISGIALYHFLQPYPENTSFIWNEGEILYKNIREELSIYKDGKLLGKSALNGQSQMTNILNWQKEASD